MSFRQAMWICVTVRVVETAPIAAVLGANCKTIRTTAGVTQDELARYARRFGLRWTASKVRDFEVGRTAPTFATVLALAAALDAAVGKPTGRMPGVGADLMRPEREPRVRLAELVVFDGFIAANDEFAPRGERVADYCAGKTWELLAYDVAYSAGVEKLDKLLRAHPVIDGQVEKGMRGVNMRDMRLLSGLTEDRLAQRLGISRDRLAALSFKLWQKPFSEERDRLAGSDANKQKRGQVSRSLRAELEKAINDGDD
jgi:transcriptional regulator with XRE-family HTH domain